MRLRNAVAALAVQAMILLLRSRLLPAPSTPLEQTLTVINAEGFTHLDFQIETLYK